MYAITKNIKPQPAPVIVLISPVENKLVNLLSQVSIKNTFENKINEKGNTILTVQQYRAKQGQH